MRRFPTVGLKLPAAFVILLGLGCLPQEDSDSRAGESDEDEVVPTDLTGVTIVPERWLSDWDSTSNLDSPAIWLGAEGNWVISTAKGTHDLWVHDASDGSLLRRIGGPGSELGEFDRPNGIAVTRHILFVVERDNHRVQMLSLPEFQPLGFFGENELIRPYGIAFYTRDDGVTVVYVTDDYGNDEDLPDGQDPSGDFTQRVKQYEIRFGSNGEPLATYVRSFGEADGPGALFVVETIQLDGEHGLLLIVDEHNFELEVYGLDGEYMNRSVANGLFRAGDPEGVMLYRCNSEGYWILTDQGTTRTVFHLLERRTFSHIGSFAGETTANTDGIWLHQDPIPELGQGAIVAVHDDGGLAAFAWEDVAAAFDLRTCSLN